ncbi:MAG TPA: ParB/RepB/Spo0J family partition protein [Thermoanaerobaculia bacterium]|nr:ParB/RepB/Spo0J family partition protein [Thermoanaerobaculia bacterium]
MASEKPTRRLGRGLDALLRGGPSRDAGLGQAQLGLLSLKISSIRNNPYQPRKRFALGDLQELQDSIKANGLLQPITVRKSAKGEGFELIAGERRLRAATHLGWKEIPAIVKDVDDRALLTFAMIENLQRADLDPIEEAEGYQQLLQQFGLTQQAVADLVGKDRTTVANSVRVLSLPPGVREMLREGKLTLGHAKPLLGLDKPEKILRLAKEIVARGLTVRDVERRLQAESPRRGSAKKRAPHGAGAGSTPVKAAETMIRRRLQTDIEVTRRENGAGSITVRFYSNDDFERILELMGIKLE